MNSHVLTTRPGLLVWCFFLSSVYKPFDAPLTAADRYYMTRASSIILFRLILTIGVSYSQHGFVPSSTPYYFRYPLSFVCTRYSFTLSYNVVQNYTVLSLSQ